MSTTDLRTKTIEAKWRHRFTSRGFATNPKLPIEMRARQLVAKVQAELEQGMDHDEVGRFLEAVHITETDVWVAARQLEPSLKKFRIAANPHDLVRPDVLKEPTFNEILKYVAEAHRTKPTPMRPIVRLMQKERPRQYQQWQAELTLTRLTEGEFVLLKALNHRLVRIAIETLKAPKPLRWV